MNKNIQSNQRYFKISQENLETSLDNSYIFDKKSPVLEKYIKNTKEIKEILTTIKILQKKKESQKIINKYLRKNPNNYWLNTAGFKNLFSDLL